MLVNNINVRKIRQEPKIFYHPNPGEEICFYWKQPQRYIKRTYNYKWKIERQYHGGYVE